MKKKMKKMNNIRKRVKNEQIKEEDPEWKLKK